MDVLATILTCSLYTDDALVRAIVDNAHDNPLSIFTPERDPDTGALSSALQTLDAALAQLREVTDHGGQPLVGLMQVPVAWAATFESEPQELFDPCINVSIGTAMLSEFDYACSKQTAAMSIERGARRATSQASMRDCVLRRYAQRIGMQDLVTVAALNLRYQHGPLPSPNDAPIFRPQLEHEWGSDDLLVHVGHHGAAGLPPKGS